ncbi:MAG TPA: hypothetical protein VGM39_07875 [Kofleriaceae bacterium]
MTESVARTDASCSLDTSTVTASYDVAMEEGEEFEMDLYLFAYPSHDAPTTWDCGPWTRVTATPPYRCTREAGQPETATVTLVTTMDPAKTTAPDLKAILDATVVLPLEDHRETMATDSSTTMCTHD